MPVIVTANYEGWFAEIASRAGGKGFTRKGKRFLLVEANRKTVDIWHRRFIGRHFDANARSRYHYQQRKAKYRGIKQKLAAGEKIFIRGQELEAEVIKKGGRIDIVRSGQTEASAKVQTPISATAGGAKTLVQVPRYIVRRRAGQPNQKEELQKLTRGEHGKLNGVWRAQFMRNSRRFGNQFKMKRRLGTRSGRV